GGPLNSPDVTSGPLVGWIQTTGVVEATGQQSERIEANDIAYNTRAGVNVIAARGNPPAVGITVRANSIHDNGGLGIDLGGDYLLPPNVPAGALPPYPGPDGVTPNDLGDPDIGPNNLQNYPNLSNGYAGPQTLVRGNLSTLADGTFTLDFYASTTSEFGA